MKKLLPVLLTLSLLTGCGAPAAEPVPELTDVPELRIAAEKMDGCLPGGEYDLPEEVVSLRDWAWSSDVALLAENGDVAFCALNDEASCPALLRWGDSLAEFDWLYATPAAIGPELWVGDLDGDGEDEAATICYGGSGTGVSLEYLYVVEKNGDGSLTSYELPWTVLAETLKGHLQTISANGAIYAALGRELVDISAELESVSAENPKAYLAQSTDYYFAEDGIACRFSVAMEDGGLPLWLYVAEIEGVVRYEDGQFTLEDLHLLSV